MLKINLLPPKEKRNIELADFSRLLAHFATWLGAIVILFTVILTSSFFVLLILLNQQKESVEDIQNDSKIRQMLAIEEKIKSANENIKQVYGRQSQLILIVPLLEEMSQIVPPDIYLTDFSYQRTEQTMRIGGFSPTRESLLALEESLEQSEYFVELESPLSNLLKQTDINFTFSFKSQ